MLTRGTIAGMAALGLALTGLVHVRAKGIAESYALGEAVRREAEAQDEGTRLREVWERLSDPAQIRARAEARLGLRLPLSEQVLR